MEVLGDVGHVESRSVRLEMVLVLVQVLSLFRVLLKYRL